MVREPCGIGPATSTVGGREKEEIGKGTARDSCRINLAISAWMRQKEGKEKSNAKPKKPCRQ